MVNICHQYQQNNRKLKQDETFCCFVDIGDICWPSLFKLSVVLLILVTYVDHRCFNLLLFCWYWWHMLTITVLTNKTTESLNSDGQHMSPISTKQQKLKTVMVNKCHQYQQNNRRFTILFKLSVVLLILVTYVDHHCFNFLLFCWYWWHMLTIIV
jgi:hypothetical protein